MKNLVKVVGSFVLALSVGACVTDSKIGSGELSLSGNMRQEYLEYLGQKDIAGNIVHQAFVVNPISGKYHWARSWGGHEARSRSITRALKKCGDGCYIFDMNKNIVWEGFETNEDYVKIANEMKNKK